jgi:hypothetical protein
VQASPQFAKSGKSILAEEENIYAAKNGILKRQWY